MARTVKDAAIRQNEILAAAQGLIYTQGYEQMTVQDILDELHISKGAFYHYFDSKQALLEAMIVQMRAQVDALLDPITRDPDLPALVKLERLFDASARWKAGQKELILKLFRSWYSDDNALVRQKEYAASIAQLSPHFTRIIQQGLREGVFATPYPEQIGEVVLTLMHSFGDAMAAHLLSNAPPGEVAAHLEGTIAVYTDALERVLGAAHGSLKLINLEMLKIWLSSQ